MKINELATKYFSLREDLEMLEMDMFASEEEKKEKEEEFDEVRDELLMYNKYKKFYEKNEKLGINVTLLYPFKEVQDEKGNLKYVTKDSEEYKMDVGMYLQILEDMLHNNEINNDEYEELKEEALEVADKQMDKIEEEEKEKEEEIDLEAEYENIMDAIKETRDSVVYNQIGENSYGILQNQYKSMTEVERKEVLLGTHTKICVEMDITCNMDFTKYELKTPECVNREGYCLMTKDVKGNEYPMEVMLFEQISKIYMKEIYNKEGYTPLQKERLALMVANNIDRQKQMILNNYKKRELDIYKG
ncbi:MAG: hypothetical protein IKJ30_01810 [Bacilli bacterium]|nr:hypothetical protein [Bacilli bacterium]